MKPNQSVLAVRDQVKSVNIGTRRTYFFEIRPPLLRKELKFRGEEGRNRINARLVRVALVIFLLRVTITYGL
jgi:ribose 1,5-bisphosphokinase PhnN